MNETDKPTVFAAWNAVMREVREIHKDQSGSGVSYKFRGIDQVMNAIGPKLREHGVTVTPHEVTDLRWREFSSKSGTAMLEAFLRVSYRVYGPSGDFFEGGSAGQASDASDKAVAQAMSVAYRTFLLQSLTMPTDDAEPDLNVVERSNAADEAARAQGWPDAAARAEAWRIGLEAMGNLPDPAPIVAWGKALDPPLSPDTLTPEVYAQWGQHVTTARTVADAPPSAEETLLEVLAPEPEFDRAAAWAMLHEAQGKLTAEGIDAVQRWLDEHSITADSLTKPQASEWYTRMAGLPEAPPPAALASNSLKAQGWKSKAERERTFESLNERTAKLGEPERTIIYTFTQSFTRDTLTKETAIEWNEMVSESEKAPF